MVFCGRILTFYLECENYDPRSQTHRPFDMTWHLQPPVTLELWGKNYIIYPQSELEKFGSVVMVLDIFVVCFKYQTR